MNTKERLNDPKPEEQLSTASSPNFQEALVYAALRDAPLSVKLVAAADRLHNARDILADYRALGDALWSQFNGGKQGTLWYHRAMVSAFTEPRLRNLAKDLDATVTELERLANDGKPVLEPPSTTN